MDAISFNVKYGRCIYILVVLMAVAFASCENEKGVTDYSGTYCLNIQNLEMTIIQTGNNVTFTLTSGLLADGTGTIEGDTLVLTASTAGSESFECHLGFSENGQSFSGPYHVADTNGIVTVKGILQGDKGECSKYDIEANGIPQFIGHDFTQLHKIEKISKFRSGFGHSFTDGSETCRSMKHYYTPYEIYRENDNIEIYSPVDGTIVSVSGEGEGAGTPLKNKEMQIRPNDQPAFILAIFHCDIVSPDISTGRNVEAGELIGYARMYYEEWQEYVTSFDIAVWVNTPYGMRLVPYFDVMEDNVFNDYISRGAVSRADFTITKEARDADPLECSGESFVTEGNLENWVTLK
jgi:hypothetical protein